MDNINQPASTTTVATDTDSGEIKQRATVEDLLNLSVDGWKQIASMDEQQLAEYLKDITELEPKSDVEIGQLRGAKVAKSKALEDIENDDDDENPIKLNKPTKRKAAAAKAKTLMPSVDDLAKELGIDL